MVLSKETRVYDLCEAGLISNGTHNCLIRKSLETVGDILEFIQGDKSLLLEIHGLGRKKFMEISNVLEAFFASNKESVEKKIITPSMDDNVLSRTKDVITNPNYKRGICTETKINELYSLQLISKRTRKILHRRNFKTIGDILGFINGDINRLKILNNFGDKSLDEMKTVLGLLDDDKSTSDLKNPNESILIIDKDTKINTLSDANLISSRTSHILNYKNIKTIGELLLYINSDERRINEFQYYTQHTFLEIKKILSMYENEELNKNDLISEKHACKKKGTNIGGMSINELYENNMISIRTFHVFENYKLKNVSEILEYMDGKEERLMNLRNFGRKSLLEMRKLLERVAEERRIQEDLTSEDAIQSLYIIADVYKEIFSNGDEISNVVRAVFPTPESIRDAISSGEYDFFTIHKEIGREGNLELRKMYQHFVEQAIKAYYDMPYPRGAMFNKLVQLQLRLEKEKNNFSLVEEIEYFQLPIKKIIIERCYNRLSSMLSIRAKRLQEKFMPTYREAIPFLGKLLVEYNKLCPGQLMRKTLAELFAFVLDFEADFNVVLSLSTEDAIKRDIFETFPFLTEDTLSYVYQYKINNNAFPLFYLLYFYLKTSKNRLDSIFSLINGIYDGEFHTLNDIADILGLTRERVRQLSFKKLELEETELAKHEDWHKYTLLFDQPYITDLSPIYREETESESLPFDFNIFSRILPLVAPFKRYQVEDSIVLLNEHLLYNWNFKRVLKEIDNTIHNTYTCDTTFHLEDFIGNIPDNMKEDALGLLNYIVSDAYGFRISENGYFTIEQNRIDVSQVIYDILNNNGKPMHIDDIFVEFKNLYPNHRYNDSKYLRPHILKNPHILPIGNSSTYGLDTWDVYFGTIRDKIRDLLETSNCPVSANVIVREVLSVIPYTKRKNILASMGSDEFVPFENNCWGLVNKVYDEQYKRKSNIGFDEYLSLFESFVETYRRFPLRNGGEHERAIRRWYKRVEYDSIEITEQQRANFYKIVFEFRYKHYPETITEYKFKKKCDEYKDYYSILKISPNRRNRQLDNWYMNSTQFLNDNTDNRHYYMKELIDYINSNKD